ncbi:MAG: CDP-diacylglycerol--serine O-phosphatidyltransferase [Nitrospira sp.]|nr:CDP-diacylglycerol--serine O-phosphatidyltransferase [bacterium]MBL7049730.1 CDP-diacylglycerol--serine O-phosphatidyltransferase [Nitrospira sp.]
MKKGIYILPNSLTMCGLFCGFYAILMALKGNYVHSAWGILIANIFDGLDGWVARLTNSTTKFGIELDSLSDLVAFGAAPAVLVYSWALEPFGRLGVGASFLLVMCGALRLARYNVQMGTTESKAFSGIPIPGSGTVIASLVLFHFEWFGGDPGRNYFIIILAVLLAVLMVSTIKFHGLKEFDLKKRKPFGILVAIGVAIVLIFMYPETIIFVFSISYVFSGLIESIYTLRRKKIKGNEA